MTEGHTGGMLALVPDGPEDFAVANGDPAEQLHCTLAFLGDDVSGLSEEAVASLKFGAEQMAAAHAPIQARILGHAHWNPDGGPDGTKEPCAVYEIEGSGELEGAQSYAHGIGNSVLEDDFPEQHSPFRPHVTAGYNITPAGADMTASGPITFSTLRLALGGEDFDYPLTGGEGGAPVEPDPQAPETAVPELNADNGVPLYFPVVMVEGMATSDGRSITPGALTHRALPLPVLAQTSNPVGGDGHDGAEVVGRIDVLERTPGPETIDQRTGEVLIDKETGKPFPEGTFVWWANGFGDPAKNGIELASKGYLTGNSADLTELEADFDYGVSEDMDEGDKILQLLGNDEPPTITINAGKIAATTLVPIPAFAQSYVVVGGETMTPNEETVGLVASPMFRSADLGDECVPCAAFANVPQAKRDRAKKEGHAMPDGSYPIENTADLAKAIKAVGRGGADHDAIRKHIMRQAKRLGAEDQIPSNWQPDGSIQASAEQLTPLPPLGAFADPEFDGPTPLTVEEIDGGFLRVYGHVATWGTCHVGFAGQCVTPPRSQSDYSYFNVGAVRTAHEGKVREVAAGHITMGEGGHASTQLSAADAAAHYDNINTVVADVTAGEDAFGPWVSGIVRRTATPEQVDALRASPLSGDWRRIGGGMELVAALAVNSGGFPIPRARVASGLPQALVAASVVRQAEVAKLAALADRMEETELLALRGRAARARLSLS